MRASFLLPSASLLFFLAVAVAACSGEGPNPVAPADAGVDVMSPHIPGDPGTPADAGGDSSTPQHDAAPMGPTTALAAAADQLADAECAFAKRCFPDYVTAFVSSLAECKSGLAVETRARFAPGAIFDKAAIDAATSCFATLSCDAIYARDMPMLCGQPPALNGAPVGAECNKANDCASGLCTGKTATLCGHCVASVVGKLGDSCDVNAGKLCPAGAVCSGTCQAVREIGDACGGAALSCGNALNCVTGKCQKPGGAGATCSNASDCDLFQLQTCDTAAGQCAPIAFVAAGAACSTSDAVPPCADGLHCIPPAGSTAGTCQPAILPGNACTRTSSCTLGYHCNTGVCIAEGAELPVCK